MKRNDRPEAAVALAVSKSTTPCILCDRSADATYRGLADQVRQGMHDSCWALRYGADPYQYVREQLPDDDPRRPSPCWLCGVQVGKADCNGLCGLCYDRELAEQLHSYRGKPVPPQFTVIEGGAA